MISTYDIFRFSQPENRLTAQLMLAIDANRDLLLKRFLESVQFDYQNVNLASLEIHLQSYEDDSRPDADFSFDGKKVLFFESKLKSPILPDQLLLHVKSGKGNIPVVCISSGTSEPGEIKQAREILIMQGSSQTLIRWIGWEQIYADLIGISREFQDKPEIAGLLRSLSEKSLATPTFKGFRRDELRGVSDFVKGYPQIYENANLLIERVVEFVKKEDNNIESTYRPKHSTTNPLQQDVLADFYYSQTKLTSAELRFDFSKGHVVQRWGPIYAKQINDLNHQQKMDIQAEVNKQCFKIAKRLEEPADLATLQGEDYVWFSRYFQFSDDVLYSSPEKLVRFLAEGILWMLNFFKMKGLYIQEEVESKS